MLTFSVSAKQNNNQRTGDHRADNSYHTQPPKSIEGFETEIYKTVGDIGLPIHIIYPKGHRNSQGLPAAVFFFGGGWRVGTPSQFEHQCRYLASRGMVAMTVEYRVFSRHGVGPVSCVRDAKSAIRWVRQNSKRLGIDPERILVGGGSAGGHLAASVATVREFDEETEDQTISSAPSALALFNPALVLARVEGEELTDTYTSMLASIEERMGVPPQNLSPYHCLSDQLPPTIIFHGRADKTVPLVTAQLFARKATAMGARCQLVAFEDQPHGFFNYGRADNKMFGATVSEMDRFLVSLGYIEGKDSVDIYLSLVN